jgi:hypothetical protein
MSGKDMDEQIIHKRKRPFLVWVISVFLTISAIWAFLFYTQIFTGPIPITGELRQYLENLTIAKHIRISLSIVANVACAIYLFQLRKVAFYIFCVIFSLIVYKNLFHFFDKEWVNAVGLEGVIALTLGLALYSAICFYLWKLKVNGVLR